MAEDLRPIVRDLQTIVKAAPDRIALVTGKRQISYGELWAQSIAASEWYRLNGVTPGDRIVISTDSRDPYFSAAYFGAHLAGAIAVPSDYRSDAGDLEQRCRFVDAKIVLFHDKRDELLQHIEKSRPQVDADMTVGIDMSSIAEIMFTTGSTGIPKGVALAHRNIAASAVLIRKFIGNTSSDSEVVTVPLTHSFGLGRLRSVLLAGGKLILVPGLVFPQLVIKGLQDHGATGLACVPGGIRLLMAQCESGLRDLADQIRYVEMGSAPFAAHEKAKLARLLPTTRICMHYGLTEASRSSFLEFHEDSDHLESVGRASPGVEIQIRDIGGQVLPSGVQGRIHVRAETIMAGYWSNESETEKVLNRESGWLDTGDLGHLDEDGFLHLTGRADDVINCGGENLMPNDVEQIAVDFPGVRDAACRGTNDPKGILGQVPLLCIVGDRSSIDVDELINYVRSRLTTRIPVILVEFVKSIPRSNSGKLLRHKLCPEIN